MRLGLLNLQINQLFLLTLFGLPFAASADDAVIEKKMILQTQIKGLLVVQLENGDLAAATSQMNATIIKDSPKFEMAFNQSVGEKMSGATAEVDKFIRVKHADNLPDKVRIEFSFEDKYTPKDGPSAAVACALMADSIISGKKIDAGFAVTGDMTATGDVRPVGGVAEKIKGAIREKCTIIAIPIANKSSVTDAYLLGGVKPLYRAQLITISNFDDAAKIAFTERTETIKEALKEFSLVQKALTKNERYINNAKVRAKLRAIVKLMPNHLSARLLYLHSVNKAPKRLSLVGSILGIDKAGTKLAGMFSDGSFQKARGLNEDVLSTFIFDISKLRPKLDVRTKRYADTYSELAAYIKKNRERRILSDQLRREFTALVQAVGIERKKLLNNREVREEILSEQ